MKNPECAFCDTDALQDRIVYFGTNILTIVSRPWFRPDHLLIIPKEHRTSISELTTEESAEIAAELKVLLPIIATKRGTIHFQKTSPEQVGNGIAMEHVHDHIYPIIASDGDDLVPTPHSKNDFDFNRPTNSEVTETIARIQRERAKLFTQPRARYNQ